MLIRGKSRISFFATILAILSVTTATCAQGGPRVITLETGVQFEGNVGSIQELSEAMYAFDPFEIRPIVLIDDGLRRVFVNRKRIVSLGESVLNEISIPVFQKVSGRGEGAGSIISVGPFDEFGHRKLRMVDGPNRPATVIVQGITKVTPRYCEVESLNGASIQWKMRVGTNTVPTVILRNLLRRQIRNEQDIGEHLKIADFFLQAGNYEQADEELRLIQQRFPDDTRLAERIERDRQSIRQLFARKILNEVRTRMDAGQTQLALGLANVFNKEGVAGEILAEFRDVQIQAEKQQQRMRQDRQDLNLLFDSISDLDPEQQQAVDRLKAELATELNTVNVLRLDAWRRFSADAGKSDKQKLALALSGWLIGSNQATDNLAVAQSMFTVRDLVSEYLTTASSVRRGEILRELEQFEAGTPQFLAEIVAWMKPIQPEAAAGYTGETPIRFTVSMPGTAANPQPSEFECLVHLPPEYDPYRRYPLLIALPGRLAAAEELELWTGSFNPALGVRQGHAMRHGYLTMSVGWKNPNGQREYNYDGQTHAVVLKALREALRKFSIDTDRVFIGGHGIGANAAYDIAISHPEHWAGVFGISGKLDRYIDKYAANEHVSLPVYCVMGERDVPSMALSKFSLNKWLSSSRYLDCTFVQYLGRANEMLPEATPEIFEWANLQKRRWPGVAGFEFRCRSLRPWDNYFWFLQIDDIPLENIVWPEDYRSNNLKPFEFRGEVKPDRSNIFRIGPPLTAGRATIWLSPDFVDFSKRIEINGRGRDFRQAVGPSRAVLLEDVRTRGDRQRPWWANIVCDNFEWRPNVLEEETAR